MSLSLNLRQQTQALHREVERAPFLRALFQGRFSAPGYAALLAALWQLYGTLEGALGQRQREGDPLVGPFYQPALLRGPALGADLAALGAAAPPLEAPGPAAAYCARLRAVASADPPRLVAHAYVRYLGDLSGGQLLRGVVARRLRELGRDPAAALHFYDFPQVPDLAAAKADFRARLDALPVTRAQEAALIAEAIEAFRLHGEMFAALSGGGGAGEPAREGATGG